MKVYEFIISEGNRGPPLFASVSEVAGPSS